MYSQTLTEDDYTELISVSPELGPHDPCWVDADKISHSKTLDPEDGHLLPLADTLSRYLFDNGSITASEHESSRLLDSISSSRYSSDGEEDLDDGFSTSESVASSQTFNQSTSILFQHPHLPFTISLTTFDDGSLPHSFASTETLRNSPSTCLIPFNNQTPLDPYHLMPPPDLRVNPSRMRKSSEARKFRKWLLSFIESKGDEIPPKLRAKMLEIYSIQDLERARETMTLFVPGIYNGTTLSDQSGRDVDSAKKNLQVLGEVFRQRDAIPHRTYPAAKQLPSDQRLRRNAMPPKKKPAYPDPKKSNPERSSLTKSQRESKISSKMAKADPKRKEKTSSDTVSNHSAVRPPSAREKSIPKISSRTLTTKSTEDETLQSVVNESQPKKKTKPRFSRSLLQRLHIGKQSDEICT